MGGLVSKNASERSNSFRHEYDQRPIASKNYSFIGDQYNTIEQVTEALRAAGLESSSLIVGIDFTKSNEWTGKQSFNGYSLHALSTDARNPYEQAISIIGRTLSAFDDDNLIPCFGFGDASTHDQYAFNFYGDGQPCDGFEGLLARYREILPHIRLAVFGVFKILKKQSEEKLNGIHCDAMTKMEEAREIYNQACTCRGILEEELQAGEAVHGFIDHLDRERIIIDLYLRKVEGLKQTLGWWRD